MSFRKNTAAPTGKCWDTESYGQTASHATRVLLFVDL